MEYPYNLFKTNNNISFTQLNDIYSSILYTSANKKSILIDYKDDIEKFILKNKLNKEILKNAKILENISSEYFNKIILFNKNNGENNIYKKIEIYYKELLSFKDIISRNINYIKNFNDVLKKFDSKSIKKYNDNLSFQNPFNIKKLESIFGNDKLYFEKTIIRNSDNNFKKTLDILTQGNTINFSMPSVGLVYNKFSNNLNKKSPNYVNFINKITEIKEINFTFNQEISSLIPFNSLDLNIVIPNILLSTYNTSSINDNESLKSILNNMVKRITVDMNDILYIDYSENILKRKIKSEYIIPYKFEKEEIIYISKMDIDRYRDVKTTIKLNNDLMITTLNNIFRLTDKEESMKILEKKNYKNVLACYLFYIINLTYDILKNYLDKIDNIIKDIALSKHKIFNNLNIKDAFQFVSSLKMSLYKFKLIMLNNFFLFFLPSDILSGNYGMEMDQYNCYIPNSSLQNDNNYIYEKYPFRNSNVDTIKVNNDLLIEFILFKSSNLYDIYNPELILEFGGWAFNYVTVKKVSMFLSDYYSNLEKSNTFDLFILNIIINNTNVYKKIPIEFIDTLDIFKQYIKRDDLTKLEKKDIEIKIYNIFDNLMELSVNYWIKFKNLKSKNLNEIVYLLCFNTFYIKAISLLSIIKYKIYDINLKNLLIEKCMKRKKYYEELLKKNI